MISHWKIECFKSFKKTTRVDLAPITILAGANSSGKSSLIQSILLMKQTLQYGPANRPLSLNGPILKLGSSRSIHNDSSLSVPLFIEMGFDTSEMTFGDEALIYANQPKSRRFLNENVKSLEIRSEFAPPEGEGFHFVDGAPTSLTPVMSSVRVKVGSTNESGQSVQTTSTYTRNSSNPSDGSQLAKYSVNLDNKDLSIIKKNRQLLDVLGGWTSHFLPSWVWAEFDTSHEYAEKVCVGLDDMRDGLIWSHSQPMRDEIPLVLFDQITSLLCEVKPSSKVALGEMADGESRPTFYSLKKFLLRHFRSKNLLELSKGSKTKRIDPDVMQEIAFLIIDYYVENSEINHPEPIQLNSLHGLSEYVQEFFVEKVRYLGPLREAPRPVYQPEALENTESVGYKGEHTAAVFELNKDTFVTYKPPPGAGSAFAAKGSVTSKPLIDAVSEWLDYLEIATSVTSYDAGVYGNTLRVRPESGAGNHDLTNVGVGVSQVLPIIVEALLAPPGSLIILEQPELHLHPKVQARLADFLVSVQQSGKRILLETHSENMIDRFRLRIVQDDTFSIGESISILFARRENGETSLQNIEVNEFGAIVNWPVDFFDAGHSDATEILKIARRKRKLRSEKMTEKK